MDLMPWVKMTCLKLLFALFRFIKLIGVRNRAAREVSCRPQNRGKKSAMGSINSISALAAKVGLIGRYVILISVVVQVPSTLRWGLISLW
jgi:hypothetical protein